MDNTLDSGGSRPTITAPIYTLPMRAYLTDCSVLLLTADETGLLADAVEIPISDN